MITGKLIRFLWGTGSKYANQESYGFALAPLLILTWPVNKTMDFFMGQSAGTSNPFLDYFYVAAGLLSAMAVATITILPAATALFITLAISIAATFLLSPFTAIIDFFRSRGSDDSAYNSNNSPNKNKSKLSSTRYQFEVTPPDVTVKASSSQQQVIIAEKRADLNQEALPSDVPGMDEPAAEKVNSVCNIL